jgi:hypothetical protein
LLTGPSISGSGGDATEAVDAVLDSLYLGSDESGPAAPPPDVALRPQYSGVVGGEGATDEAPTLFVTDDSDPNRLVVANTRASREEADRLVRMVSFEEPELKQPAGIDSTLLAKDEGDETARAAQAKAVEVAALSKPATLPAVIADELHAEGHN